jgi:hypothetical protein
MGMGIGGVVGAFGGWAFSAAAPALAGTSFFSSLGAGGTVAAYSLAGTATGGAVGYGAGFGYANHMGGIMSGVGAQIGSVGGMAGGGWAVYGTKLAKAGGEVATAAAARQTAKEAAKGGTNVLSKNELLRIENAATRINKPINVVGSRATGKAGAYSDWDYVIEGLNSRNWSTIIAIYSSICRKLRKTA